MSRYCKIVVLPEDSQHADLARGFLRGRRVDERAYELQRKWTGRNGNNAAVIRWLCEEARLQQRRTGARAGILAIIDEDGRGLLQCRDSIDRVLNENDLRGIDANDGRCLVLPVRNVETWMVWLARWQAAGGRTSPTMAAGYLPVDEACDYKHWRTPSKEPVPKEPVGSPYQVGKLMAILNSASPPPAIPPALHEALTQLGEFLNWCRL